jgi:hypothetical protein
MISDGTKKIAVRSLTEDVYVDEMPINWYAGCVDLAKIRLQRKKFRIINREHLINAFPEE